MRPGPAQPKSTSVPTQTFLFYWEFWLLSCSTLPIWGVTTRRSAVDRQKLLLTSLQMSHLWWERGQRGPVSDVDPSSGRRGERRMFTLLLLAAERRPLGSLFHPAQTNPAGRQTDATLVNIFWPRDQVLGPAGGAVEPHRTVQAGLSSSAKPEEQLCYRRTRGRTQHLISSLLRKKHYFLLLRLRWRARRSPEAKTTRPEQTGPGPRQPEGRGPFGTLTRLEKYGGAVYFQCKKFVIMLAGADFNTMAVHASARGYRKHSVEGIRSKMKTMSM